MKLFIPQGKTMTPKPKDHQVAKNNKKSEKDNCDLDLVRNILFGEQVKQTEKRGMELERILDISIDSLRDESVKKFESISLELSTVVNLLTDEKKARETELNKMRNTFDQLAQTDIKIQKKQSQLQENITKESSKLNQSIKQSNEEMSLKLEQAVEQLQHKKVDRKAIASLLNGVAKQLDTNESD